MRPFMVTEVEFREALRQHKQCWCEPCSEELCPLLRPEEYLQEMEIVKRVAWDTRHLHEAYHRGELPRIRLHMQVLWCYRIIKACGVGPSGEPP